MLERGARGVLEVGVGEVLVEDGLHVVVREVGAADAFVVGGEREGHVRGAVGGEGVVGRR